jgi:hypothetical protein
MSKSRTITILASAAALGACVNVDTCEEVAFYEYAEEGRRIEAPDDLNDLAAYKELTIPEASPRPPRDRSAGCLDEPPTLRIDESRVGEDVET